MIPRTIHQFWGGPAFPPHLARLAETWREHHPGWEYRLWGPDDVHDLDLPYRDLYDRADHIVPADAVWQLRSDLVRWVILRDHGGVWADTDTRCQRSIEPLLTAPVVVGWEIQERWIGSSTLAAEPGHPAIVDVIETIDRETRAARPGTRPNRLTGPKAITSPLLRHDGVRVLDEPVWYPVRWDDPMAADREHPGAYVVHGWQHQRDLRGLPACGSSAPSRTAADAARP